MNLLLTRFSQDVDLSNTNEVKYFLVFETPEGHEVRLPVQKETTEALVKILYAKPAQQQTKVEEPQAEAGEFEDEEFEKEAETSDELGDEYGGEDSEEDAGGAEDLDDVEPGVLAVSPEIIRRTNAARQKVPASEDEVPSL